MVEIDLIYALQPVVIIAITACLLLYMRKKGRMSLWILGYSLAAYAIAILVKIIFQTLTANYINPVTNLYVLGLYFGLQTVILEVGLAYLFARYAISKKNMKQGDGFGYGVGLAFWENGVFLGALSLLSILGTYAVLQPGVVNAARYQMVVSELNSTEPSIFYPPAQALPAMGLGILERVSSILVHIAWGYLAFIAAFYRKKKYLALALPMGLIDFFVPFAAVIGVVQFEILIFAISLVCIAIALAVAKGLNEQWPGSKRRPKNA